MAPIGKPQRVHEIETTPVRVPSTVPSEPATQPAEPVRTPETVPA